MRSTCAVVATLVLSFSTSHARAEPPNLRVRALGCFFDLPGDGTLIADQGDRLLFTFGYRGTIEIAPYPSPIEEQRKLSSEVRGHLVVEEYTNDDVREPYEITVIHNGLQSVTLWRHQRELAPSIVESCLANIHSSAPGAPPIP